MDSLTDSLNSQLQMLEINSNDTQSRETVDQLSNLSLQVNNNLAMKIVNAQNERDSYLPNDINALKSLLSMRIKYTRPKSGGVWEFDTVPNDVKYLQECIKFIDKHGESKGETGIQDFGKNNVLSHKSTHLGRPERLTKSLYYEEFLQPLEMSCMSLDDEFGIRFYDHLSFRYLRNELITFIKESKYSYLSHLIECPRRKGGEITQSWIIYPQNKCLTYNDYIIFYDRMDDVLKEWLLKCSIPHKYVYDLDVDATITTYDMLAMLVNKQNVSFQIKLLIDLLVENSGSEEYINQRSGFLPYLTYIDHLQHAIETSIPKCNNPYRTAMLLLLVVRGMVHFPDLLEEFQVRLSDFLVSCPDFTLGQLSQYLQDNGMPCINIRSLAHRIENQRS